MGGRVGESFDAILGHRQVDRCKSSSCIFQNDLLCQRRGESIHRSQCGQRSIFVTGGKRDTSLGHQQPVGVEQAQQVRDLRIHTLAVADAIARPP